MADWRQENEDFMAEIAQQEGYEKWPGGVYGKYITRAAVAADAKKPRFDSVVTCHYTGRLINGKQFDTSRISHFFAREKSALSQNKAKSAEK